jgi:hypothetical protein
MTNVDQFESVFRSAAKEVYHHAPLALKSVLVVTDRPPGEAGAFVDEVRGFLGGVEAVRGARWDVATRDDFSGVGDLLARVVEAAPDLVCTYRHLHSDAWQLSHSLGAHVDVLAQAAPAPVLLLPHPDAGLASEHVLKNTDVVMAITDHLTGDDRLVNHAVAFTEPDGRLLLAHVEDDATYERYVGVISRIPAIDTDTAREEIRERLLKEPHDFISSCRQALESAVPGLEITEIVTLGHRLTEYRRLVEDHRIDLLVLHTKDEDQFAMHGMAHPLAVELRNVPLLML